MFTPSSDLPSKFDSAVNIMHEFNKINYHFAYSAEGISYFRCSVFNMKFHKSKGCKVIKRNFA